MPEAPTDAASMPQPEAETKRNPWAWVPSLYYAEGLPYVVVMIVSVIMYKRLGISNTEIALYTSWLYLPWTIKPLWSPIVDILKTKRFWIVIMQLVIGAGLAGVAFTLPADAFFQWTLAFMWLLAFSSATHDIAADGFYMLALSQHDQAWFVGIRSTFYRAAMITGQGLLIMLAGFIEGSTGLPTEQFVVEAQPGAAVYEVIHPDSVGWGSFDADSGLLVYPPALPLGTSVEDAEAPDAIIAEARAWNQANDFYSVQEMQAMQVMDAEGPSWWSRTVAEPIAGVLRRLFGPDEVIVADASGRVGQVGVIYLRMAAPVPDGDEIVVNLNRDEGDPSIRLIEGERFTFTADNWDTPFMAVVQLDAKLDATTSTTFEARSGNITLAWTITFIILTAMFLIFAVYHRVMLPYPASDKPSGRDNLLADFIETFVSFFRKKHIGLILAFLLLYRFAEAQLVKLAAPFLLDAQSSGGLSLTTGEVGFVYGTVGIVALTVGGILGGVLAARDGLKKWLWWMVLAINLPNAVYVYLSYAMPESFVLINLAVAVEQFGYGFGFTAYMLYMIYVAEGEHKTAHFALCTGFMALGMMLPGMISGWIQEIIGYQHFFVWVVIATIPAFVVTYFIPLDADFGKKEDQEDQEDQIDDNAA